MGTRRLRDLRQRRDLTIGLFDQREDRRARAKDKFGVPVFTELAKALAWAPEALVISTPPGTKAALVQLALERGLHHFIEGDIWTYDAERVERVSREKKLVSATSMTFAFLPLVREIGPLIRQHLGALLGYQFCMATYMPSWHPGEGLEYYARHRNTAPAREMICFELNWLNSLFGPAREVAGRFEKHGRLPGDTEDTWCLAMRLQNGGVGQLAITMACPTEFRRGACFGSNGMLTWDIRGGDVMIQTAQESTPRQLNFGAMGTVLEASYADEINTFIEAVKGTKIWPQPYALSQQSSATLAAAEKSFVEGRWEIVDPRRDPEPAPPLRI